MRECSNDGRRTPKRRNSAVSCAVDMDYLNQRTWTMPAAFILLSLILSLLFEVYAQITFTAGVCVT